MCGKQRHSEFLNATNFREIWYRNSIAATSHKSPRTFKFLVWNCKSIPLLVYWVGRCINDFRAENCKEAISVALVDIWCTLCTIMFDQKGGLGLNYYLLLLHLILYTWYPSLTFAFTYTLAKCYDMTDYLISHYLKKPCNSISHFYQNKQTILHGYQILFRSDVCLRPQSCSHKVVQIYRHGFHR